MSKEIKGKKILILGYGREGQSAHRHLTTNYRGLTVGIADRKDVTPLYKASVHTGKSYLNYLGEYDTVVRTPGIPAGLQELTDYKKQGGWVTTATNIFFSACPGVTIGITGTKGKSTTASLITHILKNQESDVRLVGNIGSPMLDHPEGVTKKTIFVIELSSHQLEDIRYGPHVAVLLAIVPEHLDYYQSFDAYVAAKGNIVRFQTAKDAIVFNPSYKSTSMIAQQSRGKKLPFSPTGPDATLGVKLLGNRENVAAAVTVARFFGVPDKIIKHSLTSFTPLPHRLEFVGEYRGIRFYNDSLATIPEATIHALEALGSDVETLIAGGFDRGLSYTTLGEYLTKSSVKTLILFPDTGKKILKAVTYHVSRITYHDVTTMEEAVKLAHEHTPRGKICLLSPASASFNLFENYEDRGNQFKEWVQKMGE